MTRTQFIALFTLPFVSRFLPKEKKEVPWSLNVAKNIWLNWQKEQHLKKLKERKARRDFARKYPYSIYELDKTYWTKADHELYQQILNWNKK